MAVHAAKAKLAAAIFGVADAIETNRGLRFSRLPSWTYPQHAHNPLLAVMAQRLSGAHLNIETAASVIEVVYRSTRDSNPETNFLAGPSTISITTDGYEASVSHTNGDIREWGGESIRALHAGQDSVARFELPHSAEPRLVQIWLPQNCEIELIDVIADQPWIPIEDIGKRMWVHYGSSISHCEEAVSPIGVWPVAAARKLNLEIYNLGLSGSANLEQFAARTIRDLPADLVSLKLGINVVNAATMTARTFAPAVHGFIDTIRETKPLTPMLVISPICCPAHENNPGPTEAGPDGMVIGQEFSRHWWLGELTLSSIRSTLSDLVRVRREDDPNLYYLDGLELFDEVEALTMPDGLHPDGAGYLKIAENFVARHPKEWSATSFGE